jgi:hypothetical protein
VDSASPESCTRRIRIRVAHQNTPSGRPKLGSGDGIHAVLLPSFLPARCRLPGDHSGALEELALDRQSGWHRPGNLVVHAVVLVSHVRGVQTLIAGELCNRSIPVHAQVPQRMTNGRPRAPFDTRRPRERCCENMKLAFLFMAGCWLAATGCNSGRVPEHQAVSDAEKVVAFYLPRLLKDRTLTSDRVFGRSTGPRPGVSEKARQRLAQQLSRSRDEAVDLLLRVGKLEFHGLTGQGHTSSHSYDIGGYSHLDARRQAVFGQTALPITLRVVHPDIYASSRDWGIEIANDPRETGVQAIGKLKFALGGLRLVATNVSPQTGLDAVGELKFDARVGIGVWISHSGVRK